MHPRGVQRYGGDKTIKYSREYNVVFKTFAWTALKRVC